MSCYNYFEGSDVCGRECVGAVQGKKYSLINMKHNVKCFEVVLHVHNSSTVESPLLDHIQNQSGCSGEEKSLHLMVTEPKTHRIVTRSES